MKPLSCVMFAALACAFMACVPCFAGAQGADQALSCVVSPAESAYAPPGGAAVWTTFWMGKEKAVVVAAPRSLTGSLTPAGSRRIAVDEPAPGESLYVVESPRGLDVDLLSRNTRIQAMGGRAALVVATQESAEALSSGGMEIRALHAPSGIPAATAPVPTEEEMSRGADVVQEIIDKITPAAVDGMEKGLSGVDPVTVGGSLYTIPTRYSYSGEPIEKATQYVKEQLEAQGLTASYQDYTWDGNNWRNVYAEQAGTVRPNNVIVICGHLDDTNRTLPPPSILHGADDNASGSTSVLLAASVLKDYQFENTILYVLFTGEEQGLYGSAAFVPYLAGMGKNVIGALNFDMIAYSKDGNTVFDVVCGMGADSGRLGDSLISTISQYFLALNPNKITEGSTTASDHASFWDAGYAAILGIEDERDDYFNPNYHLVSDSWANCSPTYTLNSTKAAVGTLARLAVPVGQTQADIVLNGTSFAAGDSFSSQFVLNRSIERLFTAYAVIFLPDGSMVDAMTLGPVAPVASSVPGLTAPFTYPLLSIQVPGGAPQGSYEMVAAFFDPNKPITGRGDAFMEASKTFAIR